MCKSLAVIGLLALGATATNQARGNEWESTPAPPPPPPPPPPAESWKEYPAASAITVVFQGANPPVAQYVRNIPANGQPFYTNDALSISHIVSDGSVPCTFYGIDGLELKKTSAGLVDVGPPQTITMAICGGGAGYKAKRFAA